MGGRDLKHKKDSALFFERASSPERGGCVRLGISIQDNWKMKVFFSFQLTNVLPEYFALFEFVAVWKKPLILTLVSRQVHSLVIFWCQVEHKAYKESECKWLQVI